ncbi:MAG: tetratricopeptide repeat protein [Clostridiales bacterium]|jgi:tetratricopeptide (TPR) repeat protein|nr:tetratricopeptide repeat protein [Clostridiales bacterium]
MPGLLLALNGDYASAAYTFKSTGIKVYSFEEALYHCYTYWKESADDFAAPEFIAWVRDTLNLAHIATKIKPPTDGGDFAEKFLQFLLIADYFDSAQINDLKNRLKAWENSLEWERLKERADSLNAKDDAQKAYPLYKRALGFGENEGLFNNFAVCLMKLQKYEEAFEYLSRAYEMQPDNTDILVNYTEAAILSHNFNKAVALLKKLCEIKEDADVYYLYAQLYYETGDIRNASAYTEKALADKYDPYYVYRLADIYVQLRMYDEALQALNKIKDQDRDFLVKQAEVYIAAGHIPAAIKCIERALFYSRTDSELWIRLALYYRLNYDTQKAQAAITTALNHDPFNEKALLESARIKKALGKTKDYQEILKNILNSLKKKYRESAR